MTNEEQQKIDECIKELKDCIFQNNNDFPKSTLIEQHTIIFIKEVLGYSKSPRYILPSERFIQTIFLSWKVDVLNQLNSLTEEQYKAIVKDYYDEVKYSLKELKSAVENIECM